MEFKRPSNHREGFLRHGARSTIELVISHGAIQTLISTTKTVTTRKTTRHIRIATLVFHVVTDFVVEMRVRYDEFYVTTTTLKTYYVIAGAITTMLKRVMWTGRMYD